MRPVDRGEPITFDGSVSEIKRYEEARRFLTNNIGRYCSYCERYIPSMLAVEHVLPKGHHRDLEIDWDNFLLACVNCNSHKGSDDLNMAEFVWPHLDDSSHAFNYDDSGLVIVNRANNTDVQIRASKTIDLCKLARPMPNVGTVAYRESGDRRTEDRAQAWEIAVDHLNDYENSESDDVRKFLIKYIVQKVQSTGFWSVWMTVFEEYSEMKQALIEGFPGTQAEFFDTSS